MYMILNVKDLTLYGLHGCSHVSVPLNRLINIAGCFD